MNKKQQEQAARMTREDVEAAVRELCIASVRHDEAQARMNEAIALAREQYEPDLAALKAQWDEVFARVEAWAEAHKDEFARKKSLVFVHGTIGFRVGNPTLKPVKGMTWEKVLDALKRIAPAYVRVKEEPDKPGLLGLGEENLGTLGLRVEQQERFYAEPAKDSVKLEVAS